MQSIGTNFQKERSNSQEDEDVFSPKVIHDGDKFFQNDSGNDNLVNNLSDQLSDGSSNHSTICSDTKSFHFYTREVLPKIDFYRKIRSMIMGEKNRPTLDELHGVQVTVTFDDGPKSPNTISILPEKQEPTKFFDDSSKQAIKFGWVKGVLVRNLLNIWGVILFLRLSWVAAQAGIIEGTLIILLASVCTSLTAISLSAICTNGEVQGGGTYFMISRSLGPEVGGSIGIIFSLANAVAVAMYTVGFAETLCTMLSLYFNIKIIDGTLNDVRLVSCLTVIVLLIIVLIGTDWEAHTQVFLLIILLIAMGDFIIGSLFPPRSTLQIARGYFGWNVSIIRENMFSDYRGNHNFFSTFSIYFPAATGILAGANISGDLKDPSKAIPLGTLLSIIITTITYIVFHFFMAANVVRDANGLVELIHTEAHSVPPSVYQSLRDCNRSSVVGQCFYGLSNYYQIVELMSYYGPIIYAGIFAAALSSALASLVSAPKVFQALCRDHLFPYISHFGKGHGPNQDPRSGYLLTFAIGFACCLLGELNSIAPIISSFFLAAYTLINFSCFHASFARSPGFRPSFRFYNKWLSLFSSFLMLIVMFITDWITALLTFFIILLLYGWIVYRNPDVNWGSSTQAQIYRKAIQNIYRLNLVSDHVKNYRPQILLLAGNPKHRIDLVDLAHLITKRLGFLICGDIEIARSLRSKKQIIEDANQFLMERNIKAFFDCVNYPSLYQGVQSLVQLSGMGKLKPNIVMMGFKTDWPKCDQKELLDYFKTIHLIFDYHLSIVIVHVPEKLKTTFSSIKSSNSNRLVETTASKTKKSRERQIKDRNEKNIENSLFLSKSNRVIDVWWLYDDGGLTLLLPYIIQTRSQWCQSELRVFALANKESELDVEQRNMAIMLTKFRIPCSNVIMLTDILKPANQKLRKRFRSLIEPFLVEEYEEVEEEQQSRLSLTESQLIQFENKTNRHLRLHELLMQHSKNSNVIVMSLPMPRKETCPAVLYMAWLEIITKNMPPMMLMRGNQSDVLTFYS